VAEEAPADDEVVRAVKLIEKRFAGCKNVKRARGAGLSEINLVGAKLRQVIEPVRIGDGDQKFHFASESYQFMRRLGRTICQVPEHRKAGFDSRHFGL
jgi:hypothetical protein